MESHPIEASPEEFTRRIKGFARFPGAVEVGITKLNAAYIYSHIGRSPGEWGQPIDLPHANAIAICVQMKHDKPITFGVQDFCRRCRKYADNCPSGSISKNQKQVYQGVEKWQTNQDTCYRFWRTQGTDCAVCVKVCPYSHPATPMHNLVRRAIRRNAIARRLALKGDDLFYGRRPRFTYPLPDWHSQA